MDAEAEYPTRPSEEFDRNLRSARDALRRGALHALAYLLAEEVDRLRSVVPMETREGSEDAQP